MKRQQQFKIFLYIILILVLPLIAWKPNVCISIGVEGKDTDIMIYYDSLKNPVLDAEHHSPFLSVINGKKNKIKYYVDNVDNLNSIRIDFNEIESVELYELTLNISPFKKLILNAADTMMLFSTYNDIENIYVDNEKIVLSKCGPEAWVFASDIIHCGLGTYRYSYEFISFVALYSIASFLLCYLRYSKKIKFSKVKIVVQMLGPIFCAIYFEQVVLKLLYKVCKYLNMDKLIQYFSSSQDFSYERVYFFSIIFVMLWGMYKIGFNNTVKYRYILAVIFFVFLVAGRYNISSIGAFDKMLLNNSDGYTHTVILGQPQGIRADEWAIEKPYYFAQTASDVDLPYYNYNLMIDGADMVVMAFAPVKDLMIVTRPALWGFLFLPSDYAFSFYWWLRVLLLFLGAFELGRILLKNDKIALCAAFVLIFSVPIQWLMSQWLIEIVYSGMYSIVLLNKLLATDDIRKKALYSLILAFWINVYVYSLYPAAEIPFGYVFLAMAIYIVVINKPKRVFTKYNVLAMLIVFGISLLIAAHFMLASWNAITTMTNTVYPGHSRVWGRYSWDYELFSFINFFSASYKDSNYLNNCESAKFVYFLPFLIVVVLKLWRAHKSDIKIVGLMLVFTVSILLLVCCYLPDSNVFTDALFMKNSYPRRIYLAAGFGLFWSLWISLSCMADYREEILSEKTCIFYSCAVALLLVFLSLHSSILREYFSFDLNVQNKLFLIVLLFAYCWLGYLFINYNSRNIKTFITLYFLMVFGSTVFVNPISVGIDCLYKKDSLEVVRHLASVDSDGRWMIGGNAGIGNLVSLQGVKRCSGYYYYPDVNMMKVIDPDEEYISLWNSFTAVDMRLTDGDNFIESPEGAPSIIVYINLETAKELNIKYVYNYNMQDDSLYMTKDRLELLYSDEVDDVNIYKINYE